MFKFFNVIFFLVLIFINKSYADIVKEIRILNNERITKETILVFSDIKIGTNYNANDLDKVIKDLYKTNFFSNVSLDFSNGILTINVEENNLKKNQVNPTYNSSSKLNDPNKVSPRVKEIIEKIKSNNSSK